MLLWEVGRSSSELDNKLKAFASTLAVGVPSRIFFQGEGFTAGPSLSLKCTRTLLKLCSLKRLWCLHCLCLCSKVHAFNGWLWICSPESDVCILRSWIGGPGDSPEMRTLHVPNNWWGWPKLAPFSSQPYPLPPASCEVSARSFNKCLRFNFANGMMDP